jgi:hypothetical protein
MGSSMVVAVLIQPGRRSEMNDGVCQEACVVLGVMVRPWWWSQMSSLVCNEFKLLVGPGWGSQTHALYLLGLAGMLFDSGGVSVCNSACIKLLLCNVSCLEGNVVVVGGGGLSGAGGGAAVAAALNPLFDSLMALVTTSVNACSLCSLLHIPMGSAWGICAVS